MHGQPLGLLGPFMQMPITVPSICPLGDTTAPPGDRSSTVVPMAGTQALPALASLLCTLLPSVQHKQAGACLGPSSQLPVGLQSQRQPRKPSSNPSSGAECFSLSVLLTHICLQAINLEGTLGSLEARTTSILASPQSPCLAQSRHPEKKTA